MQIMWDRYRHTYTHTFIAMPFFHKELFNFQLREFFFFLEEQEKKLPLN